MAQRCEYIGSREHKKQRSWLGLPEPRQSKKASPSHKDTATICHLVSEQDRKRATMWVQEAIKAQQFDPTDWSTFPRHIWYRDENGQFWEGFLTNSGAGSSPRGQYKGWPIEEREWDETFN
jgi:hypothetical protein